MGTISTQEKHSRGSAYLSMFSRWYFHLVQMDQQLRLLIDLRILRKESFLGWHISSSSYVVWGWPRFGVSCQPILVHLDRISRYQRGFDGLRHLLHLDGSRSNLSDPSTRSTSLTSATRISTLSKSSNLISSFHTWVPLLLESILFSCGLPAVIWDWM